MKKHILFDCDGVLVDTEIVAARNMSKMVSSMGVPMDVQHYLENLTGSTFGYILNMFFPNLSIAEKEKVAEVVEASVMEESIGIVGVKDMLKSIDIPKSVVSNSLIASVKISLGNADITEFFDKEIFSSESVPNPKPAPDVYLLAIEKLGYKKEELLVVEDSLTGATAALEAGLEVVGFAGASHILPGHADKLKALGVTNVANNMTELSQTLQLFS